MNSWEDEFILNCIIWEDEFILNCIICEDEFILNCIIWEDEFILNLPEIFIDDVIINKVNEFLGVTINEYLDWGTHISVISKLWQEVLAFCLN